MKATELRIGTWILINVLGVCIPAQIQRGSEIDKCEIEGYKPIPLTEEWLLKFGFEAEHFERYYLNKIEFDNRDGSVSFHGADSCVWMTDLKYVHQLQNLYFALTGEELTIKTTKI